MCSDLKLLWVVGQYSINAVERGPSPRHVWVELRVVGLWDDIDEKGRMPRYGY